MIVKKCIFNRIFIVLTDFDLNDRDYEMLQIEIGKYSYWALMYK